MLTDSCPGKGRACHSTREWAWQHFKNASLLSLYTLSTISLEWLKRSPIYHTINPKQLRLQLQLEIVFWPGNRKRKHGMMWHYICSLCSLCCPERRTGLRSRITWGQRGREKERERIKGQANEILIKMLGQITRRKQFIYLA